MSHGIMQDDTMFSVREVPWHGLGTVIEDHPATVQEALSLSGLGWEVQQEEVYVGPDFRQTDFIANTRSDTGSTLGIVSGDYRVVQNEEAFQWLDTLLGGDVEFETAGSLWNGKRVWMLVKIPEMVEVGGDPTARYIYCANSHDGSLSVTAAATHVRIVCNNTLGMALRRSTTGEEAQRVYKFRHTGDLASKMGEAKRVMQIVLDWDEAFARLGDSLALQPMSEATFDSKVITPLLELDTDLGDRAKTIRFGQREVMMDIFRGAGPDGDTTGNAPGTKWTAVNAVAEYADWGRRYTSRTDQVHRSFEDQDMKSRALNLVCSA